MEKYIVRTFAVGLMGWGASIFSIPFVGVEVVFFGVLFAFGMVAIGISIALWNFYD